jgi:hypothetical protein
MSELVLVLGRHPSIAIIMGAWTLIWLVAIILTNGSVKIGSVTVGGHKFTEDNLAAENRSLRSITTRKSEVTTRIQLMRQMAVTDEIVDEWMDVMAGLFRQFATSQNITATDLATMIADNDAVLREQTKVLRNMAKIYHRLNGYQHMDKYTLDAYVNKRYESVKVALAHCRMIMAFDKDFVGRQFAEWKEAQGTCEKCYLESLFERCAAIANECEGMVTFLQAEYRRVEVEFAKTGKVIEIDQKCFAFDKY